MILFVLERLSFFIGVVPAPLFWEAYLIYFMCWFLSKLFPVIIVMFRYFLTVLMTAMWFGPPHLLLLYLAPCDDNKWHSTVILHYEYHVHSCEQLLFCDCQNPLKQDQHISVFLIWMWWYSTAVKVSLRWRMFFYKHTGEVIAFLKLQFPHLCIYNVTRDQKYMCDSLYSH